jgi:hypothetical protein
MSGNFKTLWTGAKTRALPRALLLNAANLRKSERNGIEGEVSLLRCLFPTTGETDESFEIGNSDTDSRAHCRDRL